MNNLRELSLKKSYDPIIDGSNVVNEFYIPCLSCSVKYDRCSAYFCSAALKQISKGLHAFYQNGGHARFIFSCQINANEMSNIVQAYKEKMNSLCASLDDSLANDFEIANLAYLIKHNLAEVKIAFMIKNKSAIMHIKQGLFEDIEGNKVYFSGSGNETEAGLLENAELFNVFNNFNGTNDYIQTGINLFNRLWDNTYSQDIHTEFPIGELFEKLISYNKEKIFNTQEEFSNFLKLENTLLNEDCIYLDINIEKQQIILNDFTKENILKYPQVLQSIYKDSIRPENKVFIINKLSLHDIKDIIPKKIEDLGNKVIYSEKARSYIEAQDLQINKRIKLAESIKTSQNLDLWWDNFNNFKKTVENEIAVSLKSKQLENAYHHFSLKSALDFSVPGTGKTYISYGLFAYLFSSFNKEQNVNQLVVFGPLNSFKAWKEEKIKIFGDKHNFTIFDVSEHHGDFEKILKHNKYDIYLFNYEFLSEDKINVIANYVLDDKTMVVFDEIHKLKSISGVRSNNVIKMLEKSKRKPIYRLALTGTPLPNSYADLYNYLKILYPNDLSSYLHNVSENKLKNADEKPLIAKEIQEKLHPLFTRIRKKDINIPPANKDDLETLSVVPSADEMKLFELIHKSYTNPLLKFIRLIQASSNPKLLLKKINFSEFKDLCDDDAFVKKVESNISDDESLYREEKEELIKKIGIASKTLKTFEFIKKTVFQGRKIIVWCLFINTIDFVKSELEKAGIKCVTVTGRDDLTTKNIKIDSFKYGEIEVLITNPNTLAESVSLHQFCHDAVYLEFGFNLTYLLQSKDRIHRVGLKEGTQTNYYFSIVNTNELKSSIDKKIYNRLQEKAKRMYETIESDTIIPFHDTSDLEDINQILN